MNTTIHLRLATLRQAMIEHGISAYIIYGSDPHSSEYITEHWKLCQWMSDFDGSVGTIVITLEKAALWTDSRYFLQAEEQLKGTTIELMKQGLFDTPEMIEWINTQLPIGATVGLDDQMISINQFSYVSLQLKNYQLKIQCVDLISTIYPNRPTLPTQPFFILDTHFSGKSTPEKLSILRNRMKLQKADILIISALDDIAWLFNIRGTDVPYNPVVIAYAIVNVKTCILYVDPLKLTGETRNYFQNQKIELKPYLHIYQDIQNISSKHILWLDGEKMNQALYVRLPKACDIINKVSPVSEMKSIKNGVEIAGIRQAMLEDGIALVRFFKWLYENLPSGNLSEVSISKQLSMFRAERKNAMGDSFSTIAGYAHHGAIVHYHANSASDLMLKEESLLLIDSGGQYLNGTTDITRTITLGQPTIQQKNDFTLVLKGHIALAMAIFPQGTCGAQLDILARKHLWESGLNYGHGTGHGVGHFLNVHEGPQSIRPDTNATSLMPGMIISNEPGIYRKGEYGIRIENLILVIEREVNEFGKFLQFETLTLFPFDRKLIDLYLLNETEIKWINTYHDTVKHLLSPFLNRQEIIWLNSACSPLLKSTC